MKFLKNKIALSLGFVYVFLSVCIVFADTINIHCPYCDSVGVEVLNDERGVCRCNNCNRSMLILNGYIITDDKRELPLVGYVEYDNIDDKDRIEKIIASRNEIKKNNDLIKNEEETKADIDKNASTSRLPIYLSFGIILIIAAVLLVIKNKNDTKNRRGEA